MIVEVGHFALVLAFAAALAQTVVPFWGARVGDIGLMKVGRNAALIQLALIALAFAALVNAHLTSDFSVLNVAEISSSNHCRPYWPIRKSARPLPNVEKPRNWPLAEKGFVVAFA